MLSNFYSNIKCLFTVLTILPVMTVTIERSVFNIMDTEHVLLITRPTDWIN